MFIFEKAVLQLINIIGIPCIFLLFVVTAVVSRLCHTAPTNTEGRFMDSDRLRHVIEHFVVSENDVPHKKHKSSKLMNETRMSETVQSLFKQTFKKCRPEWLINPTTGRRLELDLYNAELAVAFEYDGAQHHHYVPHYHETRDHFEYRQLLDKLKDQLCKSHGVTLIRIPHTIQHLDMPAYIRGALGYEQCQKLGLQP